MTTTRVIVSCRDADGTPTFVGVTVEATLMMVQDGDHYDLAGEKVEDARYEDVGHCYDEQDLDQEVFELLWKKYGHP